MKRFLVGVIAVFGFHTIALSFPELSNYRGLAQAPSITATYNFEGIVALSNCSGSIVQFDDSDLDDKAMVLTNGHCVSLMDPGVVMINRRSSRSFTVLDQNANSLGRVSAERLLYATMTKTDMAIYQLRQTFRQIKDSYDVDALTLSREYPVIGSDIEVISGYWRRGYSCSVEEIVFNLKESDWLFEDSIRYSRPGCNVIGGTSGSPAIDAENRMVVGVNNTINESGRRCALNNPCEIDENGNVFYERGIGYAQQTSWVYSCRAIDGSLDVNVPGCLLPSN